MQLITCPFCERSIPAAVDACPNCTLANPLEAGIQSLREDVVSRNLISAIKKLRGLVPGLGLAEAKAAVERLVAHDGPFPMMLEDLIPFTVRAVTSGPQPPPVPSSSGKQSAEPPEIPAQPRISLPWLAVAVIGFPLVVALIVGFIGLAATGDSQGFIRGLVMGGALGLFFSLWGFASVKFPHATSIIEAIVELLFLAVGGILTVAIITALVTLILGGILNLFLPWITAYLISFVVGLSIAFSELGKGNR